MKWSFLKREKNSSLIIFCNGWGHDENVLSALSCNNDDLLMLWDYRNLKLDLDLREVFADYKEVYLIAWSLGVFVANQIFTDFKFDKSIAINGTLKAIDDDFGIPNSVYNGTLDGLNELSLKKFLRRMCFSRDVIKFYEQCESSRSLNELKEELFELRDLYLNSKLNECIFEQAIVSKNDAIFPFVNQELFWNQTLQNNKINVLDASHFCFNLFTDVKDIIKDD